MCESVAKAATGALAAGLLLSACTAPLLPEDPRQELTGVPFFPQTLHQCGPAALATALGASGVEVTPDALAPEVYIPGRRGSLQVELLAAARGQGRLAYVIGSEFTDLQTELAAGNPVLVLQDLGLLGLRRWHFALVVGYRPAEQMVVLRSGIERRQLMGKERFLRSWAAGENWAAVITRPETPPATATGRGFIRALTDAGAHLSSATRGLALTAAQARWPDEPLVWLAAGNQAYETGQLTQARAAYRQLLVLDPSHVAGHNNLANTLLDEGCPAEALVEALAASRLLPEFSPLRPAVQDTLRKTQTSNGDNARGLPTSPHQKEYCD